MLKCLLNRNCSTEIRYIYPFASLPRRASRYHRIYVADMCRFTADFWIIKTFCISAISNAAAGARRSDPEPSGSRDIDFLVFFRLWRAGSRPPRQCYTQHSYTRCLIRSWLDVSKVDMKLANVVETSKV